MISEIQQNPCSPIYQVVNHPEDDPIAALVNLLKVVIPVGQIFRCNGSQVPVRLILVLDKYLYQEKLQTEKLLNFMSLAEPAVEFSCFTYGTMNDYLLQGHLFFSFQCRQAQCIYQRADNEPLQETSSEISAKLLQNARLGFDKNKLKCQDFLDHAALLISTERYNMAAFMLHQCCELLFRFLIELFTGRELKSHQLVLLCQQAGFYYPELRHIFDERERKELYWLNLLQTTYVGARYEKNYQMPLADLLFLKEKMVVFIVEALCFRL